MSERVFRRRQIFHVLRLDVGQQRDALKIIRKFRELFADGNIGFQRLAFHFPL